MTVTDLPGTFWWDAGRPADASVEPLRAVLLDLDDLFEESILVGDVTPREGLDELVNSLYFAGIPIAVVSEGSRTWVAPLVRQLIGEGIVETIVTPDDLPYPSWDPDLYGHALWELGVGSEGALAVTSSARGLRVASAAKLATLVVTTPYGAGQDFSGAAAVRRSYDGILASSCEHLHRRWWRGN